MHKCKYFGIHELVYPSLYKEYEKLGKLDTLWYAFDDRLLITLDALREAFGPIIVNDWKNGGQFRESGLRDMSTTTGAKLSQHKFGRAADAKFKNISAEKVRIKMKELGLFDTPMPSPELMEKDDPRYPFRYIRCIEWADDMSWFHFDVRNGHGPNDTIMIVRG